MKYLFLIYLWTLLPSGNYQVIPGGGGRPEGRQECAGQLKLPDHTGNVRNVCNSEKVKLYKVQQLENLGTCCWVLYRGRFKGFCVIINRQGVVHLQRPMTIRSVQKVNCRDLGRYAGCQNIAKEVDARPTEAGKDNGIQHKNEKEPNALFLMRNSSLPSGLIIRGGEDDAQEDDNVHEQDIVAVEELDSALEIPSNEILAEDLDNIQYLKESKQKPPQAPPRPIGFDLGHGEELYALKNKKRLQHAEWDLGNKASNYSLDIQHGSQTSSSEELERPRESIGIGPEHSEDFFYPRQSHREHQYETTEKIQTSSKAKYEDQPKEEDFLGNNLTSLKTVTNEHETSMESNAIKHIEEELKYSMSRYNSAHSITEKLPSYSNHQDLEGDVAAVEAAAGSYVADTLGDPEGGSQTSDNIPYHNEEETVWTDSRPSELDALDSILDSKSDANDILNKLDESTSSRHDESWSSEGQEYGSSDLSAHSKKHDLQEHRYILDKPNANRDDVQKSEADSNDEHQLSPEPELLHLIPLYNEESIKMYGKEDKVRDGTKEPKQDHDYGRRTFDFRPSEIVAEVHVTSENEIEYEQSVPVNAGKALSQTESGFAVDIIPTKVSHHQNKFQSSSIDHVAKAVKVKEPDANRETDALSDYEIDLRVESAGIEAKYDDSRDDREEYLHLSSEEDAHDHFYDDYDYSDDVLCDYFLERQKKLMDIYDEANEYWEDYFDIEHDEASKADYQADDNRNMELPRPPVSNKLTRKLDKSISRSAAACSICDNVWGVSIFVCIILTQSA